MKNVTVYLIILILVLATSGIVSAQTDTVDVIFVTDTHSHLVPFGPRDASGKGTIGGIARVATIVKQLIADSKNPLFVHSGDLFVNDIMFNKFFGVPEFKILTDLGLRVMCVGNHEFDLTPDRFKASLADANIAATQLEFISADLDMSADPELAAIVKPYTIVQTGAVNIGFFGLTPSMTNVFSKPAPDSVTNYIDAAETAVDSLRGKCDAIIGLTHLNVWDDDSLALQVPGIDLIIGGHAHVFNFQPKLVNNVPILRAGCYYQVVGHVKLEISSSGITILYHELIPVDDTITEDNDVAAKVDSLVAEVTNDPRYGPVYTDLIAASDVTISHLSGEGNRDAALGNLVTDAMRNATGTQIALDVEAWMAQPIYASKLTGADIFQAIPYGYDETSGYGFKLVTFSLPGYLLKGALEFALEEAKVDASYNLQVSNMKIVYDSSMPMGQKITTMEIGGVSMNSLSSYTVTMTDGLAQFLYLAGLSMIKPEDTGLVEYEVVRDYIIANSPIHYEVEGRIQDVASVAVATNTSTHVPTQFVLYPNFPNPFNPVTTFLFELPQSENIQLAIFNSRGQLVRMLIDGPQAAGLHSVRWDGLNSQGKSVASGVYHYQLKTASFSQTKKMVLTR